MTQFHRLKIKCVEQLTKDAVAVEFDVPEALAEDYTFVPGQYLTLRAKINGEDIRRSYSICSRPEDGLRVGIKRVEGGRFSTHAQDLSPGDALDVMTPEGRFVCQTKPSGRQFLLLTAGSGITPILSIAAHVLEQESQSTVTLVYGNRSTASIMFREAIEDLRDRFLGLFHVYHVLSREAQDVDLFHGRIDVKRVQELADKGVIKPDAMDGIYLCGPAEMSLALAENFRENGICSTKIHTELFEVPGEDKPVVITEETKEVAENGVEVKVILDGLHRNFILGNAEHTVLQAAEHAGLDLPFSCAGGMCATCRCKVVEGKGGMDKNFSLDDWEIDAGFVLACQYRPQSETLVLDFDAA